MCIGVEDLVSAEEPRGVLVVLWSGNENNIRREKKKVQYLGAEGAGCPKLLRRLSRLGGAC